MLAKQDHSLHGFPVSDERLIQQEERNEECYSPSAAGLQTSLASTKMMNMMVTMEQRTTLFQSQETNGPMS